MPCTRYRHTLCIRHSVVDNAASPLVRGGQSLFFLFLEFAASTLLNELEGEYKSPVLVVLAAIATVFFLIFIFSLHIR